MDYLFFSFGVWISEGICFQMFTCVSGKLYLLSHFSDIISLCLNKDNLGHRNQTRKITFVSSVVSFNSPIFSRARVNVETPDYKQSWQ